MFDIRRVRQHILRRRKHQLQNPTAPRKTSSQRGSPLGLPILLRIQVGREGRKAEDLEEPVVSDLEFAVFLAEMEFQWKGFGVCDARRRKDESAGDLVPM